MSGRVLRFQGSEHDEVQRLLPWYVNATLDADEHARARRHLDACAQCRGELDLLRALQDARRAGAVPAVDAAVEATLAFARLRARLPAPHAPAWPAASGSRWRGWPRGAALLRAARAAVAPGWRGGALAASCALALLAAGAWLAREPAPAPYRVLGDTATSPAVADAESAGVRHLLIVFEPRLEQARVRELLRASRARIVDGPSDAGAYVLAVPAADAMRVRESLRAAPGVALVESLEPAERR